MPVDEYLQNICDVGDLRKVRGSVCGTATLPPDDDIDADGAKCCVDCVVKALNGAPGDVAISEDGWAIIGQLALTQRESVVAAVHAGLGSLDAGFEATFHQSAEVWAVSGVQMEANSLPALVMVALMGLAQLRLKGHEALELCGGGMDFTVSVLKAVASRGGMLCVAAGTTLLDLTLPDSHFAAAEGDAANTEAQKMQKLTQSCASALPACPLSR